MSFLDQVMEVISRQDAAGKPIFARREVEDYLAVAWLSCPRDLRVAFSNPAAERLVGEFSLRAALSPDMSQQDFDRAIALYLRHNPLRKDLARAIGQLWRQAIAAAAVNDGGFTQFVGGRSVPRPSEVQRRAEGVPATPIELAKLRRRRQNKVTE